MTPKDLLRQDLSEMAAAMAAAEREAARFVQAIHSNRPRTLTRAAQRMARASTRLQRVAAWVVESGARVRSSK